ncbi:MAG: mannitol-1-phosphate 5-dehydrogenase [Alicyclobacillus herbarius]|uniref:mannitol-1-phosphate 5-dehydrogenase n=1 Tax=Alicyclobacillus herbarius TaxID=122960 RepID=UPI00041F8EE7|nr:mannitol-1-phosphate 5-dehydrogenase [Alicyclobacillus herbarius]MCL6633988.1 mannitol-1-phosphate 5-dehydrogenase [Alicyclobacillus herbarius]
MKAVHFGAGNIGRGFIGQLLHQSGYDLVFADVAEGLVEEINRRGRYRVCIVGDTLQTEWVDGVRAVRLNSGECVDDVVMADIITTAVGVGNLSAVADVLAEAIRRRAAAGHVNVQNVLACENALYATQQLKEAVFAKLNDSLRQFAETYIGFANVAVDRIAPNHRPDTNTEPLDAYVEPFFEWDIERSALRGNLRIQGAHLVDELGPYLERKLFLLNGAHAILAYVGYLYGCRTIDEAAAHPAAAAVAQGAQAEVIAAMARKHAATFSANDLITYADKAFVRFRNPYLGDETVRVGRDPIRKLGPNDRLVAPLQLCQRYDLPFDHMVTGIAAGYRFDYPGDPEAEQLQKMIREQGLAATIRVVSGIEDSRVSSRIASAYEVFSSAE